MSIDIVKQIKTMFSLFTVVPMNVTGDDVEDLSTHFWTIPLIGAFYGLVAGTSFYLLTRITDGLVSAIIVVLIVHMLNKSFISMDWYDLGDGMVATGTIEKKVNAMKDTRVGAGGVSYGILFQHPPDILLELAFMVGVLRPVSRGGPGKERSAHRRGLR